MTRENDVLIFGAGLCGLAAGHILGEHATLIERDRQPGGLVRSHRIGQYWFDLVIHLLHFPNDQIQSKMQDLMGDLLQACPPIAWVESAAGAVRFPIQNHLVDLDPETAQRCIDDLIAENKRTDSSAPRNYEEVLLRTFGQSLCELFFFPYNRKTWKRPLNKLAPSGFQWNIARPDIDQLLKGQRQGVAAYNHNGWYPRPPQGAKLRGMELLSQHLASRCMDLLLEHEIVAIDVEERIVIVNTGQDEQRLHYRDAALCTLPLPTVIRMCPQAPVDLKEACRELHYNRVRSVALCIEGLRPTDTGHWRYYTDENLLFTRLVFMNEFDPDMSPYNGWSLLAETTEPAEQTGITDAALIKRVWEDVKSCGILPQGSRLIDARVLLAEPGYVVFTPGMQPVVEAAREFLRKHDITPLGRYGHWEYSSMAQVMTDGFNWANNWLEKRSPPQL